MIDNSLVRVDWGTTRFVVCVGSIAIKIPRWNRYAGLAYGMLANGKEAARWQSTHHPQLARVYWAWGGVILIAKRYRHLTDMIWRDTEAMLPFANFSSHPGNTAIEDRTLILLDYGNDGFEFKDT